MNISDIVLRKLLGECLVLLAVISWEHTEMLCWKSLAEGLIKESVLYIVTMIRAGMTVYLFEAWLYSIEPLSFSCLVIRSLLHQSL